MTGTGPNTGLLGFTRIKSTVGVRAGFGARFRNRGIQRGLFSGGKQQTDERQEKKQKQSQLLQVDSLTHNRETPRHLIVYRTNIVC